MNINQNISHSRLVQKTIWSAAAADREFSKLINANEIAIVLVPKSSLFFHLAVDIPSGPFVLWQQWHKDMGQLSPGIIWFWPAWNRISHIVTRASITYNCPVHDCHTSDNIMVNIDLSLTFRIGPDIDAARNFVYRLGANRFDELLSAETEEAIRGLVYTETHDKINNLRDDFSVGMLTTLNAKCNAYGVQILNVRITDVMLPTDLQLRLERTSAFKAKMVEHEKKHANRVKVLEDEANKELEAIRKTNSRKIQEIVAERKRYEIERRELEEKARGEARVEEVKAMTEADILLKRAQGEEVVTKVKSRQNAESLLKKTQIQCQTMKTEAEKNALIMVKESEGKLKVAESRAKAMIARAEAEAEGAEALIEKRRYELEWARLSVLEKIASKGRKFITGEKGEAILKSLIPDLNDFEAGAPFNV